MKKEMTLHTIFINKLQALYDVETNLIKALPKMAKKANDPSLKKALALHLDETKDHVSRLKEMFILLGEKPKALKVEAIRGLIKDAEWVMKNVKGKDTLDANIIAAAQYAEHYEIAGYGTAKEWAKLMNQDDIFDLLEETLEEEKNADVKLTKIAVAGINAEAHQED